MYFERTDILKRKPEWQSIIVTIKDDDLDLYDISYVVNNKKTDEFTYTKSDLLRLVRDFLGG